MRLTRLIVVALSAALAAAPALAQKSADNVRVAANEPYKSLAPYYYPATEAGFMFRAIYQTLIGFDERKAEFVPIIAKSWKRLSPTSFEMELFDGIKFHNGNSLDAEDVKFIIEYTADPKHAFRFNTRYQWVKSVDVLGPHKIRINAKKLYATDLMHLAYRSYIVDKETYTKYKDGYEHGQKAAIGSGPYKLVSFDRNAGAHLTRFDGLKPNPVMRAPIKNVHAVFVPDRQTQIAEMLAGNMDLIFNVAPDNAKSLKAQPGLDVTAIDSLTLVYFSVDTLNRSGLKATMDPRVRKALFMAVDKDALIKHILPGGDVATKALALCLPAQLACDHSVDPVGYDPEGAKKLLAAAGYPNGFDMELQVHVTTSVVGTAIAGMLRNIGVRATVQQVTTPVMRKNRATGKMPAIVSYGPAGSWPDASYLPDILFARKAQRFINDPVVFSAMKEGLAVHEIDKRKVAYRKLMDRLNTTYVVLPIASQPVVWAHTDKLRMEPNPLSATRSLISDVFWK